MTARPDVRALAERVLAAEEKLAALRREHRIPSRTGFTTSERDDYFESGAAAIGMAEAERDRVCRTACPLMARELLRLLAIEEAARRFDCERIKDETTYTEAEQALDAALAADADGGEA